MPVTRAQRQIDFPAKKSNTRARTKAQDNTVQGKPRTLRKRGSKKEAEENIPCSPPKVGRSVLTEDQNVSSCLKTNFSPVLQPNRRVPMSPRNVPNVLATTQIPPNVNKKNLLNSPCNSPTAYLHSPIDKDTWVTGSPLKVLKVKACLFDQNERIKSPVNVSPYRLNIEKGKTPLKENVRMTPLKENQLKTPEKNALPSKARALRFDSPLKNNLCSPQKVDYPNPRILDLPLRQSPRKLNMNNSQVECIRQSPRKYNSPLKFDAIRQSPRKLGSPLKYDAIRHSPRKMVSPFRLAKQEGLCYQRAKQALHTALPERLICREKEYKQVNDFISGCFDKQKPGSLYISGAPGTGKTAVLSHTLKSVQEEKKAQMIYVNCMSVKNSQAIFNKVLGEVKGKDSSLSTKEATKQLEKCLTSKGRMICLVMDECDQLDSKNQEVLYTMFEWPHLHNSRLVLIGIANALDLTDRILPRLQAKPKCKPKIMNFPPYTKDQIVTIIKDRLNRVEVDGEQVLDPSAVMFCARKVSAVAGDMRKALDVCRRAVEMVEHEVKKQQIINVALSPSKRPRVPKKIGVAQIMKVINEVYGSRVSVSSTQHNTIPLQQKLAICSLLLTLQKGKGKEIQLGKLHENYSKVCKTQEVPFVDQTEFLSMCTLIEARGIMGVKRGKETRLTKISLKLDEKELEQTLQDKVLMSSILKNGLPK